MIEFSPEEISEIKRGYGLRPDWSEDLSFQHDTLVNFYPPVFLNAIMKESHPDGCFIVEFAGGGRAILISPHRGDILAKVCRVLCGPTRRDFEIAIEPDLYSPRVYHDRKELSRKKVSSPKINVSLADLGL